MKHDYETTGTGTTTTPTTPPTTPPTKPGNRPARLVPYVVGAVLGSVAYFGAKSVVVPEHSLALAHFPGHAAFVAAHLPAHDFNFHRGEFESARHGDFNFPVHEAAGHFPQARFEGYFPSSGFGVQHDFVAEAAFDRGDHPGFRDHRDMLVSSQHGFFSLRAPCSHFVESRTHSRFEFLA